MKEPWDQLFSEFREDTKAQMPPKKYANAYIQATVQRESVFQE